MIRVAAKTAERHDSVDHIRDEARRVAGMIQEAEYCCVFTGAGISTSAGIGDYRWMAVFLSYQKFTFWNDQIFANLVNGWLQEWMCVQVFLKKKQPNVVTWMEAKCHKY